MSHADPTSELHSNDQTKTNKSPATSSAPLIDFSEEAIVRFSAIRLQVDTDY